MICAKKFHRSIFWSDFIFKQFWNLEYQDKKLSRFYGFTVFHGQIMVWILKLSRKTANSPSKLQIVVFKSWLNFCAGYFPALRSWSTLDRLIVLGKILLADQTVRGANIAICMK